MIVGADTFDTVAMEGGDTSHEFWSCEGIAPGMLAQLPFAIAPYSSVGHLGTRVVAFGLHYRDGTVINSDGSKFECFCAWRAAMNCDHGYRDREDLDVGVEMHVKLDCHNGRCVRARALKIAEAGGGK